MLLAFFLSIASASIMDDLDRCVTDPAIKPYVMQIALAGAFGMVTPRAELTVEIVRRQKFHCVGEVMGENLGWETPTALRFNPWARTALVNAQLYAGVKRAELDRIKCAHEDGERCGLATAIVEAEGQQFLLALREFFDDLERDSRPRTVRALVTQHLANADQRIHDLELALK